MTRRKKTEIERLEEEIKNLKSENRKLKRSVRQLSKYEKMEKDEPTKKVKKDMCEDCGSAEYGHLDLGRVAYKICPLCQHRKKIK